MGLGDWSWGAGELTEEEGQEVEGGDVVVFGGGVDHDGYSDRIGGSESRNKV